MEISDYTKEFYIPQSKCGTHAAIFPKNIFCVIASSTGSGETNLMVNVLKKEKNIKLQQCLYIQLNPSPTGI